MKPIMTLRVLTLSRDYDKASILNIVFSLILSIIVCFQSRRMFIYMSSYTWMYFSMWCTFFYKTLYYDFFKSVQGRLLTRPHKT